MNFEIENYYRSYSPSSFQKYPNGENCRVVYVFKKKLMTVESARSNMVYTWLYSNFFSNYDEIILIDLLPKEFEFLFLGYISGDNVQFNARVLCTAQIRQDSNYYEMLINNVEGTIAKLKSALGRRIGFYIKSRDFSDIQSFNEDEFNELKNIIFELNDDEIPYRLIDIEDIQIELTNVNITKNLESYRMKLESSKSELNEFRSKKEHGLEEKDFQKELQRKENEILSLKFQIEKERISGTNELEIEKQKHLEKIITERLKEEQNLNLKRQKKELKLLENDPDKFKVIHPEIYIQLEKMEHSKINRKDFSDLINNIVSKIFKK